MKQWLLYVYVILLVWSPATEGQAAEPLGITPGVATNITLGSVVTLSAFNTSLAAADISYNNTDLATRKYVVRLPAGYDSNNPAKKYGLITYIDAGDTHTFPASYAAALDAHDVIWLGGQGIGNPQSVNLRRGVAIMGAFRMIERLASIDPNRVYVSGLSGGGRTASDLAYVRSDFFHGFIGRVGSSLPGAIPSWECAGTNSSNTDDNYELMSTSTMPSVVLPPYFRAMIMTQYGDFRRAENLAIYRYGHLNHGNVTRLMMRSGGHSDEIGPSFTDAMNGLYHPYVDLIWDRFENTNLLANVHAGKTVAGSGFFSVAGTVSETTYSYNSSTHGVLKLVGAGAAVRSSSTFPWKDAYGIILDARLRSENATTAGQNQQIGLHIVPEAASGVATNQPGFHLYWCYGQTYRAELVAIDGTHKTLATWEHAAPHPMLLASTDKTFWGDTAAPDYAGRTKAFRGEDVRLVLNTVGFQLTFNRAISNFSSSYAGVVQQISDSSTPYSENIPLVIQGYWSEVETSLVNALPSGLWQLMLSNDALVSGQACGNAVVDEIHLIGASGLHAAPPLAVTAPGNTTRSLSWTRIQGAMGYVLQRSAAPDGPFDALASVGNAASTHSDTVPQNIAYYYRIAALGSDAVTGRWSTIAFAARNVSPPAAPTTLSVTYPGVAQVRLAWADNASNETGYRLERSPASCEAWTSIAGSLAANTTVYTDATVSAGMSYDYRLSAVGSGGLSGVATVTAIVPGVAPSVPTGLTATSGLGQVQLAWSHATHAASYLVKRSFQPGGPYETIASGLTATNFTNSGLSSGTTYYYVVAATNASGASADSAEVSAQPPPGLFQKADNATALDLGGSWVPGSSPTALDTALWDGTYASGVVGIGTGLSLRKLLLANPSQAVTISAGSGPLMIGDGGIDLSLSTKSLTLNPPVLLTASQAWPVTNSMNLYLNQIVSDGGAGHGLTFSGAGSIVLASNNTYTGSTTLAAGTLHLGVTAGSTSGGVGGGLNLFGGTLRSNRTGQHEPIAGALYATNGTIQVNMASGIFTLNASNLTAGSSNVFSTLTGASGATCVVDGDPASRLRFGSSTPGFNVVVRKGQVLYNTNGGASNVRIEGGSFTSLATDRFTLSTSGQTFTVTSGEVNLTSATQYGFRVGGGNSPNQAGAQLVTGSQSGGSVRVYTFNMGGTDTTAVKSPSYTLTGGTLSTIVSFTLGADTTGIGSSTFALNGTGKLVVPNTISGAQAGAKQLFAFTGGTLVAALINATNLRDQAGSLNGTLVQSGGTLAPGDEGVAGKTALTGNYSLSAGKLAIDVGGTNQATAFQNGQYDYLTVSGTTMLAGDLAIHLVNGFVPSNTTVFTVLSSSGILSGAFGNVAFGQRLATVGGEGSFLVTQTGNTVRLSDYRPALSLLEAWRQLYFETTLDAGNAANSADPDHDGLSNLFEYAFGGLPNSLSSAPLPTLTYLSPGLRYTFFRARADVTYVFEISPDLVEWTHKVTNPGNVGETVVVEDTTGAPRRFLRLRVIVTP